MDGPETTSAELSQVFFIKFVLFWFLAQKWGANPRLKSILELSYFFEKSFLTRSKQTTNLDKKKSGFIVSELAAGSREQDKAIF